jgi:NADPH:quinone reductase-like Zn-dependent oxidoreductase
MLAAVIERFGASPKYGECARPVPGPGQVLIRVEAAALNPVDLRIASGTFYGGAPELPYIPGGEGSGSVVEAGQSLKGRRVRFEVASGESGGLAEWTAINEAACSPIPDDLPWATAAGLGIAGVAAWISLVDKVRVRGGERVLILGATGTAGQIGVQIARLLGAGRVVAAGRDPGALARTLDLGADAIVAIAGQSQDDLAAEFEAAAGGPLEVVFDPLWGQPLTAATMACGQSARIVNLGQSAGPEATLTSAIVRGRQLTIFGHANPSTPLEQRTRAFLALAEHAAAGRILIATEELPLSAIGSAWARQASSPHVKLVLIPGR